MERAFKLHATGETLEVLLDEEATGSRMTQRGFGDIHATL